MKNTIENETANLIVNEILDDINNIGDLNPLGEMLTKLVELGDDKVNSILMNFIPEENREDAVITRSQATSNIDTIVSELGIDLENDTIEANCGTVWVKDSNGDEFSISAMPVELG